MEDIEQNTMGQIGVIKSIIINFDFKNNLLSGIIKP